MNKFFMHLHTVNKHRFEVFKLCCKVGIPFQGFTHDLSKYSYVEFKESVKYYTDGTVSPLTTSKKINGYSEAWLHHFGRNKHHFEYWYDYSAREKMPIIPFKYMLEMICDRIAASKIYYKDKYNDSKPYEYFMARKDKYILNNKLKDFLEEIFLSLKDNGESILSKKYIYGVYLKYTKKQF